MWSTSLTSNDLLYMLDGAWVTLQLTFWAILGGSAAGLAFGLLRALLPRASLPLSWLLDVFRSVPLLIQFVLLNSLKSIAGVNISAFSVGCIVLGVYTAAYFTEIVRAGVLAVPLTVRRASRSLGLSYWQDLRWIVLPMATRVAFPGWLNLVLGDRPGHVDRHRRTAAGLADDRDADSGTVVGAVHRRTDLLLHEPGGGAPGCPTGKELARA
jgi:His/Glu/Gln/Arg/opine family amino acid ABC transporter permease subunit